MRHAKSRLRDRVSAAARRARRCALVRTIGRDPLTTPEVQPPRFPIMAVMVAEIGDKELSLQALSNAKAQYITP